MNTKNVKKAISELLAEIKLKPINELRESFEKHSPTFVFDSLMNSSFVLSDIKDGTNLSGREKELEFYQIELHSLNTGSIFKKMALNSYQISKSPFNENEIEGFEEIIGQRPSCVIPIIEDLKWVA